MPRRIKPGRQGAANAKPEFAEGDWVLVSALDGTTLYRAQVVRVDNPGPECPTLGVSYTVKMPGRQSSILIKDYDGVDTSWWTQPQPQSRYYQHAWARMKGEAWVNVTKTEPPKTRKPPTKEAGERIAAIQHPPRDYKKWMYELLPRQLDRWAQTAEGLKSTLQALPEEAKDELDWNFLKELERGLRIDPFRQTRQQLAEFKSEGGPGWRVPYIEEMLHLSSRDAETAAAYAHRLAEDLPHFEEVVAQYEEIRERYDLPALPEDLVVQIHETVAAMSQYATWIEEVLEKFAAYRAWSRNSKPALITVTGVTSPFSAKNSVIATFVPSKYFIKVLALAKMFRAFSHQHRLQMGARGW
jgi:hypothetical protein